MCSSDLPAGGYLDSREPGVEYAEGEWIPNAETGEMEWHAADGTVISQSEWAKSTGAEVEESSQADAEASEDAAGDESTESTEAAETTGSGDED